jgi:hypothetical protein
MVAQTTPTIEQDLAAALTQAQADHERAEREYEEADLAYRRVPVLAPVLKTEARRRRSEAATILRVAGERLASARAALNSHRAAERQRQQQGTNEQRDNRDVARRAADAAAFEAWQRGQV